MNRYYTKPQSCDPHLIWFEHGKVSIKPEEVVYLSSLDNYTEFHLKCGTKVISSRTLKIHQVDLLKKGNFERVHRKFMLNMNFVKNIEKIGDERFANLITGEKIAMSRRQGRRFAEV